MLVATAAGLLSVEADFAGGSLAEGIQLSKVQVETEEFKLKVLNVEAGLEFSCLWRSRFCFRHLKATTVEVVWDGGEWQSGATSIQGSIIGSRIVIADLQSEDALLVLREHARGTADKDNTPLTLPVDLVVDGARLERAAWDIYGSRYQHEYIALQGQWIEDILVIEQADLGSGGTDFLQLVGNINFSGEWPFELDATVNWDSDPLRAVNVEEVITRFFPSAQSPDLSGIVTDVSLHSPWTLSVVGSLLEQSFALEAALSYPGYEELQLSLSGRHTTGQSRLVFEAVDINDHKTQSALSGSGELVLGEKNDWKLSGYSGGFLIPAINDKLSGRLAGTFAVSGSFAAEAWDMAVDEVNLEGLLNDLPARIEGRVTVNNALLLSDSDLRADLAGAVLQLKSRAPATEGIDLELTVAELGSWLSGSSGSLELSAAFNGESGPVSLRGSFRDFRWRDFAFSQAELTGLVDPGEGHDFNVQLNVSDFTAYAAQLTTLSLRASGNEHKQSLQLSTTGDIETSLSGEGELSIEDSFSFALEGGLGSRGALLTEGYDLNGKLQLKVDTTWDTQSTPAVSGAFKLLQPELRKDLGEGHHASVAWDNVSLRFSSDDEGLQLSAEAVKENSKPLALNMNLPGRMDQPLSGDLLFHRLDVQPFQAFIPALSSLEGIVNGQIALSGTREKILGHGDVELVDGGFSLLENPTRFESMQLNLKVREDKAELLGDLLLGGGRLDITGSLGYKPEPFAELQLLGKNETLLFPPSTQLQISQDLKLLATPDYLNVTGELTVHEGVLEHEQLPAGGVALSDDVVLVGYTGPRPRSFDLAVDVKVNIEDKFKVIGSVVDVTVGGDLHLLQERARPMQLFGNLNVIGGELRAYGQRLQVGRGTVAFAGSPENPALDMSAERPVAADDVTVGLKLAGTLEDPLLEVYSDPAMPQTQALSYLIRGRGLDVGAGADGTALALSMGASMVNQTGVMNTFDAVPGVNSVELSAEGAEDDTTATISGYIGERIYLSYGVGLYEPINVLTARLYLQTRLWLEVVSSLENSLDLYYSFDIK